MTKTTLKCLKNIYLLGSMVKSYKSWLTILLFNVYYDDL